MRNFYDCVKKVFVTLLLVGIFSIVIIVAQSAFATEGGGGGGSGGNAGCSQYTGIWTCFGATWRYRETTKDSVYIGGLGETFSQRGTVRGCGVYGGYWIYGMVYADNGGMAGMLPIGSGGYGDWDFVSEKFGGGMHYRGPSSDWRDKGNLKWEDVEQAYKAQAAVRNYSHVGELGWNYNSGLMWFCGPKPGDTYTLTAIAITDKGKELGDEYTKTASVSYEYWGQIEDPDKAKSAAVTMDQIVGYKKVMWGTKKDDKKTWTNSTDMTYTEPKMYGNKTIYAIYKEDEFRGMARVFEGDSTSGTNYSSTDWADSNTTADTLDVDCGGPCNVTFDLSLKSLSGVGGSVNFAAYKIKNDEQKGTLLRQDTMAPSKDGEPIPINGNTSFTETLEPGETMCYYVTFGANAVTAKACAHVNVSTYEGKLDVGDVTTEWKNTSTSVFKEVDCASSGCSVTFSHRLKRTSGGGSLNYTIARTSNYWVSSKSLGVEPKSPLSTGKESFSTNPNRVYTETLTLMPGQVVCETLVFKPGDNALENYGNITLKACVSALGKAQPDDPSPDPSDDPSNDDESDAFVKMQVKNASGKSASKYKKFQSVVYAKPGQTLEFRATYNPKLQYTYYLKPQRIRINGGTIYPTDGTNTSSYLYTLFNNHKGDKLKDWNNDITVYGEKTGASSRFYTDDYSFTDGDTTKQSKSHKPVVQVGDVGKEIKETVKTNAKDDTKTTPSQIIFANDGSNSKNNVGDIKTDDKSSSASAYVPYNYDTSIGVSTSDDSALNAGDTTTIDYEIVVKPRINPETTDGSDGEKYATKVPEAVSKVIIYIPASGEKPGTSSYAGGKDQDLCAYYGLPRGEEVNSSCREINRIDETLNGNGSVDGSSTPHQKSIEVPDVPAGRKLCVAVAVYPANSGAYTNWSDGEGSHSWRISDSKCFAVGKRPTFQVWGGSFYGGGNVTVSSTAKKYITLPSGSITVDKGVIVFSSWVEQTVVAKGEVKRLASGAAAGLSKKNEVGGGSLENPQSFCRYRVPLNIANYGSGLCQGSGAEQITGSSGVIVNNNKKIFTEVSPDNKEVITEGNYTINRTVGFSGVRVIEASGNVTINGNIEYANGPYNNLEQIPKMVIYAKGNIIIGCGVTRVDALLLSDGIVYSCDTYAGKSASPANEPARSNQLVVNGAILTKGLELGRTYGAGTGVASMIPAEIVNYDTSIILWAKGQTEKDDFDGLHQVYQNELAPRR